MQAELIGWIQAGGSIVLIGVTAWYAWLTRQISKASQASARSAAQAAEAASQSVLASFASLNVGFDVRPSYRFGDDEAIGVTVWATDSTVFVHRAYLHAAYVTAPPRGDGSTSYALTSADRRLTSEEFQLPVRIHRNESVDFITAPPTLHADPSQAIAMLEVSIWYSLDGQGEGIERRVSWVGEADMGEASTELSTHSREDQ